jgi:hypothetical protein
MHNNSNSINFINIFPHICFTYFQYYPPSVFYIIYKVSSIIYLISVHSISYKVINILNLLIFNVYSNLNIMLKYIDSYLYTGDDQSPVF